MIGSENPAGSVPSTHFHPVQSTTSAKVNGTFVVPCERRVARSQCLRPSPCTHAPSRLVPWGRTSGAGFATAYAAEVPEVPPKS